MTHGVVSIVRDPEDALAARPAVGWAIGQLRTALESKGTRVDVLEPGPVGDLAGDVLLITGIGSARA